MIAKKGMYIFLKYLLKVIAPNSPSRILLIININFINVYRTKYKIKLDILVFRACASTGLFAISFVRKLTKGYRYYPSRKKESVNTIFI